MRLAREGLSAGAAAEEALGGAHLSNDAGEGQFAQEKLSGLLKVPNLPKRAHSGAGAAFFYWTSCHTCEVLKFLVSNR